LNKINVKIIISLAVVRYMIYYFISSSNKSINFYFIFISGSGSGSGSGSIFFSVTFFIVWML